MHHHATNIQAATAEVTVGSVAAAAANVAQLHLFDCCCSSARRAWLQQLITTITMITNSKTLLPPQPGPSSAHKDGRTDGPTVNGTE